MSETLIKNRTILPAAARALYGRSRIERFLDLRCLKKICAQHNGKQGTKLQPNPKTLHILKIMVYRLQLECCIRKRLRKLLSTNRTKGALKVARAHTIGLNCTYLKI